MSQKPPDPPRDAAEKDSAEGSVRDANDSTAPQGIPAVSRNIEIAADAALGSMRVSFTRSSGSEHERRTLPPPVPMEQLVERMMFADSDRAPPSDIKPLIHAPSGDSNPPGSDVDTVRTRMADMQRVPMSPAPSSAPLDDAPTAVPYPHDADTLPPANIADDTEPGFRPLMTDSPPAPSAIDTAEAVLEEFGVEFFKGRPTTTDVPQEEQSRLRPTVDASRPKAPEDRWRPAPNARLTPPRTILPNPDAVPPSSSTGRNPPTRKRTSEPGRRQTDLPPPSSNRLGPVSGSISDRLLDVRERYESGDHRAALHLAESILLEQPDHLAALGYAESCRQMLRQKYLARIGDMAVVPRIKHVAIELARLGVDARDIRIVDAIDGVLSVEEIVGVSGISTLDVLRVLHDLVVDGLVEFVGRR
jgi:hypothetical protein